MAQRARHRTASAVHGDRLRRSRRAKFQAADAPQSEDERELLAKRLWKESTATGKETCPPSWSGHWMDWYRMRADEIIARRGAEQALPSVSHEAFEITEVMVERFIEAYPEDAGRVTVRYALEAALNGK